MTLEARAETFESLAAEWDDLFGRASHPHIFLSYTWQRVWWDRFSGTADLHLLAFRRNGDLVAIAPLMLQDGRLTHLGGTDLVDYHDVLLCDVAPAELVDTLTASLADLPSWTELDLQSIPEWSPILAELPGAAARHGWSVEVLDEDVSPGLSLPDTWEEYLAGLGRKRRHELRRKQRRLEAAGEVEHLVYATPDETADRLGEFIRLHRMSTPEKAEFLTPEREAFFRAVTAELAPRDMVRLYFLHLNGEPVATSLCFEHAGTRLVYNSGFDPKLRSLSVGVVNHAMVVRRSIAEGIKFVDFLRGNERYKYDLGARDRRLHRVVVTCE